MDTSFEDLNLHIEKASTADVFETSVQDAQGKILAKNEFRYKPDLYILSRLEDSVGKNIPENAKRIKDFGSELFNTVFREGILDYYKSLIAGKKHIRLTLFFKQNEPELMRIPWEFMHDGTNFLSSFPQITLSRSIEGITSDRKEKIQGRIKMLAVISSPLDLKEHERLQIETEKMLILQAIDRPYSSNLIDIEFLDAEASLRNIKDRLDSGEYHILHYTGHGSYSMEDDKACLVLEDDSGKTRFVDNERIADLLAGYKSLRLVVLSGCQTAKTTGRRAFSDLSTPLLIKGIPAVISMQYSITDESGLAFARKFYMDIADGIPLDRAVSNVRKELLVNLDYGKVDFATPVFFCSGNASADCLVIDDIKTETTQPSFTDIKIEIKPNISLTLEQLGGQFIGRQREIRQVKEDFFSRGVRAVVLHGIGGIGKTVTATRIAERFKESFHGIFSFNCREGLTSEEILIQLNEFLKRNGIDVLDKICTAQLPIDVKMNYLAQALSQIRLLIIFDNVESLLMQDGKGYEIADRELKDSLKELVNQCKDGTRFIFTSRYTFNLMDGRLTNVLDEINLGEFSKPEAIMVMNKFPAIAKEDFDLKEEIFKKIGGHPYTINIFGKHANAKSAGDVLRDIADVNGEMIRFTLLENSYKNLSETAKGLINRASVFKKAIPLEGLEWMMEGDYNLPAIMEEIKELIHWGLIIMTGEKDDSLYHVHTIVKDFIKGRVDKGEWKQWLIKAAEYYEHIAMFTQNIWTYLDAREMYFDAKEYDRAGEIAVNVTEILHTWGLIELVRRLNEETVETVSGTIKTASLHNLGMIHENQGDYDRAIEKYTQSLKMDKELGNKNGIAYTLAQLGNIHLAQGEHEKAIEKYMACLELSEELSDRKSIAKVFHQLGNLHYKQGDYDKAIEKYNQSLQIKEELRDERGIAITLHQFGMIHQKKGDYDRAIEKYNESLKIKEELGDKRGIAVTLHQLGNIHYEQGDYEGAIEKYNYSLKINEELENKANIGITLYQLGMIHYDQGDIDKAIEKYNQSLQIREELGDKYGIASILWQFGRIYEAREDYKSALRNYMISFSIFKALGSPDSEIVNDWINKLKEKIGDEAFKKYYNEIIKESGGIGEVDRES